MNQVEELLLLARAHGAAYQAEQEVGDLQRLLRACWARLTPELQRELYQQQRARLAEAMTADRPA